MNSLLKGDELSGGAQQFLSRNRTTSGVAKTPVAEACPKTNTVGVGSRRGRGGGRGEAVGGGSRSEHDAKKEGRPTKHHEGERRNVNTLPQHLVGVFSQFKPSQ